jgi:hypothetical protein
MTSVGRIGAELSGPLDGLADSGRIDAAIEGKFRRADVDVRYLDAVSGLRIYCRDGHRSIRGRPHRRRWMSSGRWQPATRCRLILDRRMRSMFPIARAVRRSMLSRSTLRPCGFMRHHAVAAKCSASSGSSAESFRLPRLFWRGISYEFERRRRYAQASFFGALNFMAEAIDMRDSYTAGHTRRVAAYSRRLARAVDLPEDESDITESGALLHDIGKIGVADAVLVKPGPLEVPERRAISLHPALGARLLGGVSSMTGVVPCVLHHHERIDGDGYPAGLRGKSIPWARASSRSPTASMR